MQDLDDSENSPERRQFFSNISLPRADQGGHGKTRQRA